MQQQLLQLSLSAPSSSTVHSRGVSVHFSHTHTLHKVHTTQHNYYHSTYAQLGLYSAQPYQHHQYCVPVHVGHNTRALRYYDTKQHLRTLTLVVSIHSSFRSEGSSFLGI
jgi:hypothetical protein